MDNFTTKVEKTKAIYLNAYLKKSQIVSFLRRYSKSARLQEEFPIPRFSRVYGSMHLIDDLMACGSFLEFYHFPRVDETRLMNANFCKRDRLCQPCAIRRAYKQQRKFLDYLEQYPYLLDLDWYYIVTPVKHSFDEDILTVYERLNAVKRAVLHDVRKGRGFVGQFLGGMWSIEVTKTDNGWNVHLNWLIAAPHGLAMALKRVRNRRGQVSYQNEHMRLFLEKYADSQMHNVQKLDFSSPEEVRKALLEVLKYSLKFSSMAVYDVLYMNAAFYRKNLFGTFGLLRRLKLEDVELSGDDLPDEEFVRYLYRRVGVEYELIEREEWERVVTLS